ncbi:nitrilase-related carbon-nitrogen hydrolase [Tateyamaria sp.]|uniref:nitrilase-related carbon-nitrogen hydrolase n=1 Tax=Tateyamaria sp. TaxID=1929288 RepID=UPI0039B996C5
MRLRRGLRMHYMPIWHKCREGHVLAGSGPATDALPGGTTRPVNRARLFDTDLGKIGILISYDSEFPLFGRALAEANFILVPSVTKAFAGYSWIRIDARARALENQHATVMSSVIGPAPWSSVVDVSTGLARRMSVFRIRVLSR